MKQDAMLIIVGDQSLFKSSVFQKLAFGKDFFTESITVSDLADGKKAVEKSMGKWIAEIKELNGLRRVDVEALKSFLSIQTDRHRLPYGHRAVDLPRLTMYVGTSNPRDILTDPTGNRRYWILEAVKGSLNFDPNQLWGEAVATLKTETTWLSYEDEIIVEELRRPYFLEDPLTPEIQRYLQILLPSDWYNRKSEERMSILTFSGGTEKRRYISVIEIWCECLQRKKADITPRDQVRFGNLLTHLFPKQPKKKESDVAYGRITTVSL
jgi:predicted P-loop ATPase